MMSRTAIALFLVVCVAVASTCSAFSPPITRLGTATRQQGQGPTQNEPKKKMTFQDLYDDGMVDNLAVARKLRTIQNVVRRNAKENNLSKRDQKEFPAPVNAEFINKANRAPSRTMDAKVLKVLKAARKYRMKQQAKKYIEEF